MTPREFGNYCKGYEKRERAVMEKLAWHAANIMNMWIGKKSKALTVQKLLGKGGGPSADLTGMPVDIVKAKVRAMKAKMGI